MFSRALVMYSFASLVRVDAMKTEVELNEKSHSDSDVKQQVSAMIARIKDGDTYVEGKVSEVVKDAEAGVKKDMENKDKDDQKKADFITARNKARALEDLCTDLEANAKLDEDNKKLVEAAKKTGAEAKETFNKKLEDFEGGGSS